MKTTMRVWIVCVFLVILFFLVILVHFHEGKDYSTSNIYAQEGVYDLSDIESFDNKIFLNGDWKFYWERFIASDGLSDTEPSQYINVNNYWSKYHDENGKKYGSVGFATYALRLINNQHEQKLSLGINNLYSSFRLYINGELIIENGKVSSNPEDTYVEAKIKKNEFILPVGDTKLILEVSSFGYSGLGSVPYLYSSASASRYEQLSILYISMNIGMLLGAVVIALVYVVVNSFQKKQLLVLVTFFLILIKAILSPNIFQMFHTNDSISYDIILFIISILNVVIGTLFVYQMIYVLGMADKIKIGLVIFDSVMAILLVIMYVFNLTPYMIVYIDLVLAIPFIYAFIHLIKKYSYETIEYIEFYLPVFLLGSIGLLLDILFKNNYVKYNLTYFYYAFIMFCIAIIVFIKIIAIKKNILLTKQNEGLEKELAKANTSILLSQMKPHFMYNTLNTIKYLITIDPEKAEYAIVAFSKYLRTNIGMIDKKDNIPFMEEFNHISEYVNIELLRFSDMLEVEYRIETRNFYVPPLSIQPIVENAIKHGVTKKIGGGKVIIHTYEDTDFFYVNIVDNGVGFNMDIIDENSQSIGLKNTRERLKEMCNGTLEISSLEGEGTTVIIILPKKDNGGQQNETNLY